MNLDGLDLHGHGRQRLLLQPVELVKAAPGAALDQADEDATHGLDVDALVAVEHQDLPTQESAKSFDALGLSGACRAVGISAQPDPHRLGQGQVALVGQGRVNLIDKNGC